MKTIFFILVLVFSSSSHSSNETDNHSSRNDKIFETGPYMDNLVSQAFDKSLKEMDPVHCGDLEAAKEELRKTLSINLVGTGFFSSHISPVRIYAEETLVAKNYIHRPSNNDYAPSILVHGTYIGTDKMDEFFSSIDDYLKMKAGNSEWDKAIHANEKLGGVFGEDIFSHADVAAKTKGVFFWGNVFGGTKPSQNINSYFKCEGTSWVRTDRAFTFKDYINDSWDEAINCSYKVKTGEKVVPTCPVDPNKCVALRNNLGGGNPDLLLHSDCLKARSTQGLGQIQNTEKSKTKSGHQ